MIKIIKLQTVNSTNNFAKNVIAGQAFASSSPENAEYDLPFAIIADEQTEGRGRYGKSFFSPGSKGVYLSYVCEGKYGLDDLQQLTVVAAAVVHRVLQNYCNDDLSIKWINDIYRGERKLAGILTERVDDPAMPGKYTIIIGVGVNVIPCEVPTELESIIGFLYDNAVNDVIDGIATNLVNALNDTFADGSADDFPSLIDYYLSHCYNLPSDFADKLLNE